MDLFIYFLLKQGIVSFLIFGKLGSLWVFPSCRTLFSHSNRGRLGCINGFAQLRADDKKLMLCISCSALRTDSGAQYIQQLLLIVMLLLLCHWSPLHYLLANILFPELIWVESWEEERQ